ncbi:MAG: ABC transporter permease [Victivallales bacterium]|nr:ABC transporter permease [Victivallales bacterium]
MKTRFTSILWILFGLAGMLLVGVVFNQLLRPREAVLPNEYAEVPDYEGIAAKITGTYLRENLETYTKLGNRFTGSPAFYETEKKVTSQLEELGYRIIVQEHEVVVPQEHPSRPCQLLDEEGKDVEGFEIYPYYPNRLRTATTPPEGITGTIVFKGDPEGEDKVPALDNAMGNIMLMRVRERSQEFANFGAKATLFFLDEEDDPKPHFYRRKDSHASINFPMFFIRPKKDEEGENVVHPKSLIGKKLTVKARVDWTRVKVRNVFAILDPDPNTDGLLDESLLITAYYDAWSPIPGLAPGARELLGLQGLMQTAAHLAASENRNKIRRKVIFSLVAGRGQASAGSRAVASALGGRKEPEKLLERLDEEKEEFSEELALLKTIREKVPDYFANVRGRPDHVAFWDNLDDAEVLFREELSLAADGVASKAEEDALQARLQWLRTGSKKGDKLDRYLAVNKRSTVYSSMVGAKPYVLVSGSARERKGREAKGYRDYFKEGTYWEPGGPTHSKNGSVLHAKMYEDNYDAFARERMETLLAQLDHRITRNEFYLKQNDQDRALFHEVRGPDGKRPLLGVEVNFSDKTKQLVLASGGYWWASRCVPADREIELQFKYAQEKLFPEVDETNTFSSRVAHGDLWSCGNYWSINQFHTMQLTFRGHTSFALVTRGDNREYSACPMDTIDDITWDNVVAQERVIIAGLEQLALGGGKLIPTSMPTMSRDFKGLTNSVRGNSLVPNHPEPNTVVQLIHNHPAWYGKSWRSYTMGGGYWTGLTEVYPVEMSDERGRYRFRSPFSWRHWQLDFHAARSNLETGDITWTRDLGYEQKYKTRNRRVYQIGESTRIILFRCSPVHIFKAENPKSMKLYDQVQARLIRGFSKPKRFFYEQFYTGEYIMYLQPDDHFFPTFLSGSPQNQSLLSIAGISLNVSPEDFAAVSVDDEEIEGRGFLAADHEFMYHPEDDLARSMAIINRRRTLRYGDHGLLQEHTLASEQKARKLATEGEELREGGEHYKAFKAMKDSLAYSTAIHPVIKDSKAEAVYGIIFYLLLLIPFAFFMEKLVLGSSDIRLQIAWVGAIFLAVFMVLRQLHPAFLIVRSSFMILLGFITLMLSVIVTFFVSAKFRAAVSEYQKVIHGQQTTTDVTKAGAAMTGFLLGINNMRKRKVRTTLTATTLVLITFVMICFTAVENDYKEVMYPIGKAPYTGLEIRRNTLAHLGTQSTVLVQAFEEDFDVAVRRWDVGGLWGDMPANKKLEAETYISPEEIDNLPVTFTRASGDATQRWVSIGSMAIGPSPDYEVKDFLLCGETWFETEIEKSCILSVEAAAAFGITPEMVRAEEKPTVLLKGKEMAVINLFDAAKLAAMKSSKDELITPIDLAIENPLKTEEKAELRRRKRKAAEEERDLTEEEKKLPEREPTRLNVAKLVLFPKQRQPKPEGIRVHFKGKLRVNEKEPISFDKMFITKVAPDPEDTTHEHYWFRNDDGDTCFIPARMAAEMQITPEKVETSDVRIQVQGTVLSVKGIYESNRFENIRDLDGETLAPYDVESIIGRPREDEAEEDEMPEMMKRLTGDDIIICNDHSRTHGWHVASIAIDLTKAGSHKEVRTILDRYLEKTGMKAFYGIGDTAYFGAKFRRSKGSNYLELLIPLLIASLTVLNTMRGSVYERKDEIYVYNAVGLNPFHVFFLFIAEACVYAVVGALGGYLVANGAGKIVALFGWGADAGLTINYSSIYAVLYSVVIMIAVLVSTWFPARAAARLAAPAEEMKWRVPQPTDGVISFDLPFTFSVRDRVAIVAYFMGWFDEFGEGSSAKFYCAPPTCSLERFGDEVASTLRSTTWLRPYDLGVSQEMAIQLSEDRKTGQTMAHLTLTHLSGGASAWIRTNYLFLKVLRKHFLDWRVVPEIEKLQFLQKARELLGAPADLLAEEEERIQAQIEAIKASEMDEEDEDESTETAPAENQAQ